MAPTSSPAPARRPRRRRVPRVVSGIFDGPARDVVAQRDRVFRRALVGSDGTAALLAIGLAVVVLGDDRLRWQALIAAPIAILVSKVIGLYDRDELVLRRQVRQSANLRPTARSWPGTSSRASCRAARRAPRAARGRAERRKSTLDESPQLFQLSALYALLISLLQSQLVDGRLGVQQVVGLWALLFFGAFAGRMAARTFADRLTPPERCLVIGDLSSTEGIGAKLDQDASRRHVLAGRLPLDFGGNPQEVLESVREAVARYDAHRVLLAPQAADSDAVLDVIRLTKSLGVKVSLLPRLFEVVGTSVVFDDLDGVTVLGVRRFGLTRSSAAIKRTMDVGVAGVGLLVVAPVLLVIALAVRLDSPGPLLFRQKRVGRDGHHFEMLKFRSMVEDADDIKLELKAEAGQEGMFKLENDPRVTRFGRILRKTSLDELPQFFNVLRGDMSLVGPRPLVVEEDELVQGWHRRRLHLVPGMTGPWQVLGSTRVPLQEMVKIDYLYIANWSLWRDVKIILRTVAHVLRRDGL